ncbi:hypothetical protein ACHAW5_006700 [Stephanodiscus triporus]|uniref:Uncharacterized protein n=1 Tax=Stephanodiscus triporus TaxID=2934178 RepID=A0ABD3QKL2_9STRA
MMTWKDASGIGAIISPWAGFALAVIGWLVGAVVQSGSISLANLGANEVMLSGSFIAIFSYGINHFLYSKFVDPQNLGFAIHDSNIHFVTQDLSGLGAEQRDKEMVDKTRRWITTRGYFLTFDLVVLVVLWPVASTAAKTFIESYFVFRVLLSVIWAFGAAIIITVLPLWESQDEIVRVIVGNFSFCTGNLAAFNYADEKTLAKAVKEQAESGMQIRSSLHEQFRD